VNCLRVTANGVVVCLIQVLRMQQAQPLRGIAAFAPTQLDLPTMPGGSHAADDGALSENDEPVWGRATLKKISKEIVDGKGHGQQRRDSHGHLQRTLSWCGCCLSRKPNARASARALIHRVPSRERNPHPSRSSGSGSYSDGLGGGSWGPQAPPAYRQPSHPSTQQQLPSDRRNSGSYCAGALGGGSSAAGGHQPSRLPAVPGPKLLNLTEDQIRGQTWGTILQQQRPGLGGLGGGPVAGASSAKDYRR
jgi:hypothetical protein